jgi:hypothetical protein
MFAAAGQHLWKKVQSSLSLLLLPLQQLLLFG